jgi:hypothetical protein
MLALIPELISAFAGVCAGVILVLVILFVIFSKHWPSDL